MAPKRDHGTLWWVLMLSTIFVVLAYSDVIVEAIRESWSTGWVVVAFDLAVLASIFFVSEWGRLRLLTARRVVPLLVIAALFVLLDVFAPGGAQPENWSTMGYIPLLALVFVWVAKTPVGEGRTTTVLIAPVLIGLVAGYAAGVVWNDEILRAARADKRAIDAEFFKQSSQLLPVLLVALAFEWRRELGPQALARGVHRALSVFPVVLLFVAELLVLIVLTHGDEDGLGSWLEYIALALTFTAATTGFTAVLASLAQPARRPADRLPRAGP